MVCMVHHNEPMIMYINDLFCLFNKCYYRKIINLQACCLIAIGQDIPVLIEQRMPFHVQGVTCYSEVLHIKYKKDQQDHFCQCNKCYYQKETTGCTEIVLIYYHVNERLIKDFSKKKT